MVGKVSPEMGDGGWDGGNGGQERGLTFGVTQSGAC